MRASNRIKQLQKVKQRPKTMFYQSIKYLTALFQVFGQFPIRNLFQNEANLLKHDWLSGAAAYSLMYVVFLWCCQYFFLDAYEDSNSFAFWCYALNMTTNVICLFSWPQVVTLIQRIERFHFEFETLPVKMYVPRWKNRDLFWVFATVFSLCIPCTVQILDIFISKETHGRTFSVFSYVIAILAFIPRHLQSFLYMVFCVELTVCFKQLHTSWKKYLLLCPSIHSSKSKLELEKYWILHLDLSECMRLLSSGCGLRIASIFFDSSADIVNHVLQYYILRLDGYLSNIIVDLYIIVITCIVADLSDNVNKESLRINQYVYEVKTAPLTSFIRYELVHLNNMLYAGKEELTAKGLFVFNRRVFGNFILNSLTYFIVGVQLYEMYISTTTSTSSKT